MRRSVVPIVLLFGLSSASGCSSQDDATSKAPDFDACGGVLTGTWQIVDADFDDADAVANANARLSTACSDTFRSFTFDAVGVMVTFVSLAGGSMKNAPGKALYERSYEPGIEVTEELVVSVACVDEQFGGADCIAVGEALRTEGAAECSAGGPPCSCTVTRPETTTAPETIAADGGQFTTPDGEVYEFCREGDTLEQVKRNASGKLVSRLELATK